MEEELDLRPYIDLLLKRWYLIVGAAVFAAVVTLGVSFVIPPTYKATALVAATEPRFRVQLDPRIEEQTGTAQPLSALPELATSDELLQEVLSEMRPMLAPQTTLAELREILEATSGSDPTLVRLSVRHSEPTVAADAANTWAELFVATANEVFGDRDVDQQRYFEDQLAEAGAELEAAEEAYVAFQAHNRTEIIENELKSLSETQASFLADQRAIALLLQDIEALRDQLDGESSESVTLADQLTAFSLQLKAFNADFETDSAIPLQLQIDSAEALSNRSRDQQVAYLSDLVAKLEARLAVIDTNIAELEPQILALQQQKQEVEMESTRLSRDRDIADETYVALARKVKEEQITSQDFGRGVLLVSKAAVPEEPESAGRLLRAVVAGFLGLIIASVAIIGNSRRNNGQAIQKSGTN